MNFCNEYLHVHLKYYFKIIKLIYKSNYSLDVFHLSMFAILFILTIIFCMFMFNFFRTHNIRPIEYIVECVYLGDHPKDREDEFVIEKRISNVLSKIKTTFNSKYFVLSYKEPDITGANFKDLGANMVIVDSHSNKRGCFLQYLNMKERRTHTFSGTYDYFKKSLLSDYRERLHFIILNVCYSELAGEMFACLAKYGCICFKGEVSIFLVPLILEEMFIHLMWKKDDYIGAVRKAIIALDKHKMLIDREFDSKQKTEIEILSGFMIWNVPDKKGNLNQYSGEDLRRYVGL